MYLRSLPEHGFVQVVTEGAVVNVSLQCPAWPYGRPSSAGMRSLPQMQGEFAPPSCIQQARPRRVHAAWRLHPGQRFPHCACGAADRAPGCHVSVFLACDLNAGLSVCGPPPPQAD